MSKELQLSHDGQDESDEDSDRPDSRHYNHGHEEIMYENEYCETPTNFQEDYTKNDEYCEIPANMHEDLKKKKEKVCKKLYTRCLREAKPKVGFTVSTEVNKKKETWKPDKFSSKAINLDLVSATVSESGIIGMIDTFDRPADASAEKKYARAGKYVEGLKNEPGKRLLKAGVYAEAGVGRASAEYSIFRVEAKGPNASAGAEASTARLGVGAMAQAEIASVSASVGPLDVKVGLGLGTGAYIGLHGVEAKFLGFGFSIGRKTGISLLGSELSFQCIK